MNKMNSTNEANASTYQQLAAVMERYSEQRLNGKVVDYHDYTELKAKLHALPIKEGEQDWASLWLLVETYLQHSVKTAHPQFFNQLWSGQSEPALVGAVIESLANTSMYTYEAAPVATLIEKEILERFKTVFGFTDGEAQVTTGGSNSNYIALLLALHKKFPQIKQKGVSQLPPVAVFVSEEAHYSSDKAMVMSGLGLDALIKVPVDASGRMLASEVERLMEQCLTEGRTPLSLISTAGSTVRGAYDDIESLSLVAKKFDCWFHVDGAWGGAVAFSGQHKQLLNGSNKADSLTWDAHKMLGVPLMCGVLFVKEQGHFDRVCNIGDTSYIFHEGAERENLGPQSLQCGRRVDMFKMWLEYVFYGDQGFAHRIDNFMDLSAVAEARINAEPTLELQSKRWINNICFRSVPKADIDVTAFNKLVREKLYKSGDSLVNVAYLGDDLTIRLIISNKDIGEQDINTFFDNWLAIAEATEQELQQCA